MTKIRKQLPALAALVDPAAAARNLRKLVERGLEGALGMYEAIDFTDRRTDAGLRAEPVEDGEIVQSYLAHHQGMTLVALANVLLDDVMVHRFHADPRVRATELLLQERVPRGIAIHEPRPREGVGFPMKIESAAAGIFPAERCC